MTTLREHLEAIRDMEARYVTTKMGRFNYEHAVAALAILDDADDVYAYPSPDRIERRFAYVYDPKPSG